MFVARVYPEGENKTLTLRAFYAGKFSEEDVRRRELRLQETDRRQDARDVSAERIVWFAKRIPFVGGNSARMRR